MVIIQMIWHAIEIALGLFLVIGFMIGAYKMSIEPMTAGMNRKEKFKLMFQGIAGALIFYIVIVLMIGLAPAPIQ